MQNDSLSQRSGSAEFVKKALRETVLKMNAKENSTLGYDVVTSNFSGFGLDGGMSSGFFDTYYDPARFQTETALAVLSTLVNVVVLVAIRRTQTQRTGIVYNALFVNLVIANMSSSILSWLCNNMLVLFEIPILTLFYIERKQCLCMVYLMFGSFVSSAFGVVCLLTMLGFAIVQYLAICKPLEHLSIVRRSRLICFIALSWIISLLCGCTPFIILLIYTEKAECTGDLINSINRITSAGTFTAVTIMAVIYIIIVIICCRIYVEVKLLQKRLSRFRFEQDVNYERRAFVTTVILLSTLTFFYLPYTVIYIVSENSPSSLQQPLLIYYMMLLPYLKWIIDPVVYGARMREVREVCFRMSRHCGCKDCFCWVREFSATSSPVGTCSIQLRNLPSDPHHMYV